MDDLLGEDVVEVNEDGLAAVRGYDLDFFSRQLVVNGDPVLLKLDAPFRRNRAEDALPRGEVLGRGAAVGTDQHIVVVDLDAVVEIEQAHGAPRESWWQGNR